MRDSSNGMRSINRDTEAIFRDRRLAERKLAFAVIHRALKDMEDLYDRIREGQGVAAQELLSARQTYRWFLSDNTHLTSFLWWIELGCRSKQEEVYYRSTCVKFASKFFPTINSARAR